jgi:hypothetical protein
MTNLRFPVKAPFVTATALAVTLATFGCAPSIDPAAKADIDRRVSALGGSGPSVGAPTAFMPMPFSPGQWTQHKMIDGKGQPSFMTYKIVGQDGDAFWVEAVTENYHGKTVMKMLLAMPNRMDPNGIDIRAVTMKDNKGNVTKLDGPMLSLMRSMYQGAVSTLVVNWQGLPQENATVPGGNFAGCYKTRTDAAWGPWKSASTAWSHPAVPISGLVRSQGIDQPTSMELTAFGLTGAVSEL